MLDKISALTVSHDFVRRNLKEGSFAIDCTAGRGYDTVFLGQCVGESGRVLAFDIQDEAINSTNERIKSQGLEKVCTVIKESHSNIDKYAQPLTVDCIMFNFGWLPNGDHKINTKKETSIEAIDKGLEALKIGGIMSLCIYYGRDTGFEEKEAILEHLKTIDDKKYTVIVGEFVNRGNCPPIPVFIVKQG